jgi:hypothetical protein
MHENEWKNRAKSIIKAELARQNIDYVQLAERLKERLHLEEDNINLSNKINRGTFSFIFALQIFEVLELKILRLRD